MEAATAVVVEEAVVERPPAKTPGRPKATDAAREYKTPGTAARARATTGAPPKTPVLPTPVSEVKRARLTPSIRGGEAAAAPAAKAGKRGKQPAVVVLTGVELSGARVPAPAKWAVGGEENGAGAGAGAGASGECATLPAAGSKRVRGKGEPVVPEVAAPAVPVVVGGVRGRAARAARG